MLNKTLCIMLAAVNLFAAVSCSGKNESSSALLDELNENKNDFTYDEGFFIPPTPKAYEYSFSYYYADKGKLEPLVDTYFGDGAFGQGILDTESETDDYYEWFTENYTHSVSLNSSGYYCISNDEINYDYIYPDIEYNEKTGALAESERIFENRFNSTEVSFFGSSYTLDELSGYALEKLSKCDKIIAAGTELEPFCAVIYSDANGNQIYADITYRVKLGNEQFSVFSDNMFFSDNSLTEPAPQMIRRAYIYGENSIFYLNSGAALTDIKQQKEIEIISCEQAIQNAYNELGTLAKHITLKYAELEYSTVSQSADKTMTALPSWALYYTDDKGKDSIIRIEAQTGEVRR